MSHGRKKHLTLGDCFSFPVGDERALFAQVVFISKVYKDVAAIRIWPDVLGAPEHRGLGTPEGGSYLLFCDKNLIRRGKWAALGNSPLGAGFAGGLRFQSGGDVFLGDEHVGPASESDRASLPELEVAGDLLMKEYAADIEKGTVPAHVFRVPADW